MIEGPCFPVKSEALSPSNSDGNWDMAGREGVWIGSCERWEGTLTPEDI